MIDIGKKLKNLREYNNFTQKYVADYLEVSQKTLSNIENAENDIYFSTIQKLSKLYNVTIHQILELNVDFILNNHQQSGGIGGINTLNIKEGLKNDVLTNKKDIEILKNQIEDLLKIVNNR